MKLVGYVRVSCDRQVEEGVSLAAQEAKLRAYAAAMDLELVEIVVDAGESAKSLERPGLKRVLEMLDWGAAEGVLVAKLDRLTRSVVDFGSLIKRYFGDRPTVRECRLISVSDSIDTRSAAGRLMLNVLMSFAEFEREAIGERTRAALDHLRANGVRLGPPRVIDKRPEVAAMIVDMHQQGWSARRIARILQARGVPTARQGGRWGAATVTRILRASKAALTNRSGKRTGLSPVSPRPSA